MTSFGIKLLVLLFLFAVLVRGQRLSQDMERRLENADWARANEVISVETGQGGALEERAVNEWALFGAVAAGGVAVWANKSFENFWKAYDCKYTMQMGRGCWLLYVGSSLLQILGPALAAKFGGAAYNGQDGGKHDELFRIPNYDVLDQIALLMQDHGHTLLASSGYHGELNTRDSLDNGFNNTLTWSTGNKTRVSMFRAGTALQLLTDALGREEHGTLEATLIGGGVSQDSFTKRDQYFDVNWFSLEWDNVNHDLAEKLHDEELREFENWAYDSSVPDWFSNNPAWKYCYSMISNPNPGTVIDMSNPQNAIHGEIYFNTWGGVDSECNDQYDEYFVTE